MVRITLVTVFTLTSALLPHLATAIPQPQLTPDPAGAKNVGNGAAQQFIGGACLSSADCQSACCAVLPGTGGICSGPGAQFQSGKQGCGFGDDDSSSPAVSSSSPSPSPSTAPKSGNAGSSSSGSKKQKIDKSLPGAENVGTGSGEQFITGQCFSDADCASACCAKPDGFCSSPAVAFDSGKQGCGFVN